MRCFCRATVLMEVLLALTLFVGAGTFTLGAVRSVLGSMDRAQRELFAADLARSKIAELEAGLITIEDLRGEWSGAVGSIESDDVTTLSRDQRQSTRWVYEIDTHRTEFAGLSLVELTVREQAAGAVEADETSIISFTLRQLVRLRIVPDQPYQEDELLRGLQNVAVSGIDGP